MASFSSFSWRRNRGSLVFFFSLLFFLFLLWCFCFFKGRGQGSVAIASVMRHPSAMPRWLAHHRELGIARFVLRLEDADEVLLTYLRHQPDVVVHEVQNEFGDEEEQHYTTLMDRQKAFVNQLLDQEPQGALRGIEWVLFIDDDEYLQGSLAWFAAQEAKGFYTVKLQNVEAVLAPSTLEVQGYVQCGARGKYKCRSYANGKGGGRVEPGVALMGPHDFGYQGTLGGATCYEMPFASLHLLHMESPTFLAWTDKYLRLQGTKTDACPFPWYHDSVKAVGEAYALYLRTVTQPLLHEGQDQDQDQGQGQDEDEEREKKESDDNYHRKV